MNQISLGEGSRATYTDDGDGLPGIGPDLAYLRLSIVNVVFFGVPGASDRE